ncbi:hypothetical protein WMF20_15460 [Sorangium sp. So ce834]|uniref:DUF6968 family protein n=1 Tax=Sorangium sp. So ce834 TaxID=3133321 RepID=UPI003F616324
MQQQERPQVRKGRKGTVMEIYSSLPLASLAPLRSSSNELIFTGLMVAIGQPREVQPGEWACPSTIDGVPEPRSDRGLGIDGVSALLNALHAIRFALEASGVRISWEGGEPGDAGFPKLTHYAFGVAFSQRMEQLIDEEIQKLVDEKNARGGR